MIAFWEEDYVLLQLACNMSLCVRVCVCVLGTWLQVLLGPKGRQIGRINVRKLKDCRVKEKGKRNVTLLIEMTLLLPYSLLSLLSLIFLFFPHSCLYISNVLVILLQGYIFHRQDDED